MCPKYTEICQDLKDKTYCSNVQEVRVDCTEYVPSGLYFPDLKKNR